ncbi:MAG: hypothetical protein ACI9JD_000008 [Rhodococcus sp. (in: high G+C Gram-positive bacteria)]
MDADGSHAGVLGGERRKGEQEKLCLLVLIGVRADGRKEVVALTDGYSESTESWADLLRGCRRPSMPPLPLRSVTSPSDSGRTCGGLPGNPQAAMFHKQSNVIAAEIGTPGRAKDIYMAEDIGKAQIAIEAFELEYGAKYPKAVAKIVDDIDVLLEFYKYPAKHWGICAPRIPLNRRSPQYDSGRRSRRGRAPCCGTCHDLQIIDAARARWRAVNAPHLVARVRPARCSTRANCSNDPPTSRQISTGTRRFNRSEGRLRQSHLQDLTISQEARHRTRSALHLISFRNASAEWSQILRKRQFWRSHVSSGEGPLW